MIRGLQGKPRYWKVSAVKKVLMKDVFAGIITRLSALLITAPEIFEMDLNPLIGNKEKIMAVDARINIKKS